MTESSTDKSFGDLPTLGHDEELLPPPPPSSESPFWTALGLSRATTHKPSEGILDDAHTDASRRWRPGDILLGRYVVEGELGQGGMGVVYSCIDRTGGVRVAIKCLPSELSHNSVEMEDVRENFRLVVDLRHPCVAGVRTLEKDERGGYFLVMDIAEGQNLRKWIRAKWKSGGILLSEAIPVLRQVASALDYAHGRKIVHRDIKPGNVMIAPTGEVKVLDFGLADQIRTSLSRASQAYRGTSGTGPYMSPEQWRGRQQNGKTDQYALAIMAYEMLAGHLPFDNSDPSVLREVVLKEDPEPIPSLPVPAMAALHRALSKAPENRFPSCTDFVSALSGQKSQASTSKSPVLLWLVALLLAISVGVGVWWWQDNVSRKRQEAAVRQAEAQRLAEETARQAEAQRLADEAVRKAKLEWQAQEEAKQKAEEEAAKQVAEEKAAVEKRAAEEARLAREREAEEKAAQEKTAREAEAQRQAQEAERRAQEETPKQVDAIVDQHQQVEQNAKDNRQPGTTKTITLSGGATMEMVWCPPGSFMMGSPTTESGRYDDETQHQVLLTAGFWMAKTEVTQNQWQKVMGYNPSQFKGDNLPVEWVSWDECTLFCRKAGNGLRLPTEAEWEYACRAESEGRYGGTGQLEDMGWYIKNTYQIPPVGQKQPNQWGLYDMHGGVYEWCEDWYGSYPCGVVTNPIGPATGKDRVMRGGCWDEDAENCRSAFRWRFDPTDSAAKANICGLRPVCSD